MHLFSCQFDNRKQCPNILSQAVSGLLRCRTLASVRHHTETSQTAAARWRSAAGAGLAVVDPISDQLADATDRACSLSPRIQCKASRRKRCTAQATWAEDVTGDPIRSDQCQHRRCSPHPMQGEQAGAGLASLSPHPSKVSVCLASLRHGSASAPRPSVMGI